MKIRKMAIITNLCHRTYRCILEHASGPNSQSFHMESNIDFFGGSKSHPLLPIMNSSVPLPRLRACPEQEGCKSSSFQGRNDCVTAAHGREIAVKPHISDNLADLPLRVANRASETDNNIFCSAPSYGIYSRSMSTEELGVRQAKIKKRICVHQVPICA